MLGPLTLLTGLGFLNARPWSRILGFALSLVLLIAIGLVVNIGNREGLTFGPPKLLYGVPYAIIMVYYNTRYDVQAYLLHSKVQVQDG